MDLHDLIAEELVHKKSLSALVWLINQGRELEFRTGNALCFISKSNSSCKVSLWVNHIEQGFDSVEELVKTATIGETSFLQLWDGVIIETLF